MDLQVNYLILVVHHIKRFIEGIPDIGDPIYGDASSATMQNFLTVGIKNMIWFFGLASIPIFIFIVPVGVVLIIKNRKNSLKNDFQDCNS